MLALGAAVPALAIAAAAASPAAVAPATIAPAWPGGLHLAVGAARALADGEATPAPRPRLYGAIEVTGKTRKTRGYVAFTFDDGPSPDTTPKILAALHDHDVPGAFFVCGYHVRGDAPKARAAAAVLGDEQAAGCLIGNHTLGHVTLATADRATAAAQILGNERELAPRLGHATRLFRPPYGKLSPAARTLARDLGYTVVRWSIDVGDFRSNDERTIRKAVVSTILAEDGGLVLLHDVRPATARALPGILADLEKANCQRLAAGKEPILPVTLDYFALDEAGEPLPVPPEVAAQTDAYRRYLDGVCQTR
jgi:peptidoglycan/xylan/chitin deacetylase (PgdA/CDA1 family)